MNETSATDFSAPRVAPYDMRRLDALTQRLVRYRDRAAMPVMDKGEGDEAPRAAFPLSERKAELLGMAEELNLLMPGAMIPEAGPIGIKLHQMKASHAQLAAPRERNAAPESHRTIAAELPKSIRTAREHLMPPRRGYSHENRFHMNQQSGPHLDFLRQFVAHFDADAAQGGAAFAEGFAQLAQFRQQAGDALKIYAFSEKIDRELAAIKQDDDLSRKACVARANRLDALAQACLSELPLPLSCPRPAQEFYTNARFHLLGLYRAALESPSEGLVASRDELRLEACRVAQRACKSIGEAYRKDRQEWGVQKRTAEQRGVAFHDPRLMGGRTLPMVFEARWSLMADELAKLIDSNKAILGNPTLGTAKNSRGR